MPGNEADDFAAGRQVGLSFDFAGAAVASKKPSVGAFQIAAKRFWFSETAKRIAAGLLNDGVKSSQSIGIVGLKGTPFRPFWKRRL